ncbi:DUF982 domain-containing protein [Rhizobium favelukesii]|uniref:DUF982 domain-containing protein n=1 Tax=Rhizobium favelukesii TaxID=348824 RepID=UPI000568DE68|nr:DUF982 domain-containing protein [Rhizobium favelukesii]MCS0459955.1 DUF982 domain-containing protein [Rhizobium favelukesii]
MDLDIPVFIKPLEVEIDGHGKYRHAETVQDLARMLLSKWPGSEGEKFHSALMRSIEAMEWYVAAATARSAFVDAAHEAGMHVLPDDMDEMKKAS